MALLLIVAVLDTWRPWHRDFSLLYLLAVVYAGWTTTARPMAVLTLCSVITVFLAPAIAAPDLLSVGGVRNRIFGVVIGLIMAVLLWDRRRFASELERANRELERRVAIRTAELDAANRSLRAEIQHRQKTEEGLREAQRLEAIGRLAGGIAHDFNNLLTIILGYADFLQDPGPTGNRNLYAAEQISLAGRKAAGLIQKLLAFSRRQVLQPSVFSVNDLLTGLEGLLRRLLPENIRITLRLDPSAKPIRADRSALEQAMLNLAANARDALPAGGDFALITNTLVLSPDRSDILPELPPGTYVRLIAVDTGCGMDETTRSHVFEPFFTTKELGKGTGLGLASVHGVIKQSGGHIEVSSELGRGTTFTILLPCVAEAPTIPEVSPPPGRRVSGDETILLVEDDHSVRKLTSLILQRAGYTVLSAANGPEAIELMDGRDGPIHLLITDTIMPGLSGPELAAVVGQRRPSTNVLFVSGHALDTELPGVSALPRSRILAKPYTAETLTNKTAEILGSARDTDGAGPGSESNLRGPVLPS